MKKSRIIAAALAAVLLVGGAVIKICGADSNKELEPTLPLETKISKEQAVKDLKYVFDTVSANHPAFLKTKMQKISSTAVMLNCAEN